jgi:hypothetical protein
LINRSPTAYRANPTAERTRYSDAGREYGDQDWGVGALRFGVPLRMRQREVSWDEYILGSSFLSEE